MELFTYLMAKNDHNTSVKKDLFSYLLGKNQSGTYTDYSGTSLSINNTKKGKMKVNLLGNVSQYTTTGKNKLDLTGITTRTIASGITITPNFNGNILQNIRISGTPTATAWQTLKRVTLAAGSYILTGINISDTPKTGLRIGVYIDSSTQYFIHSNLQSINFTINEQTSMDFVIWVQSVDDYPTGDIYITPMIRLSSVSDATYEPYTNGASPNPSYPQDVNVVSGDNEVVVCGKNLLGLTNGTYSNNGITAIVNNGEITLSGTASGTSFVFIPLLQDIVLLNQTITLSANNISTGGDSLTEIRVYTSGSSYLACTYNTIDNSVVYTNKTDTYNRVQIRTSSGVSYNNLVLKPMLEKNNSHTTYEPYQSTSYSIHLGDKELCKISTYQDRFIKTTGKNLFDKTQATTGYLVSRTDGTLAENSSYGTTDFIPVKAGEQYTFTNFNYWYTAVYDENKNYLSNVDNLATITIPNGAYYLRGSFLLTNIDSAMFNEGSTPLPYEPYGTNEWYLEKKIGKVVLDGSEDITSSTTSVTNHYRYFIPVTNIKQTSSATEMPNILCSHYKSQVMGTAGGWGAHQGIAIDNVGQNIAINDDTYYSQDATAYKNWLSSNNVTVYYAHNTPTYTQITGTLKDELEALQKAQSYKGTTNINQINNDLPFNMDVSVKVGS